jgi:hypothetical protein
MKFLFLFHRQQQRRINSEIKANYFTLRSPPSYGQQLCIRRTERKSEKKEEQKQKRKKKKRRKRRKESKRRREQSPNDQRSIADSFYPGKRNLPFSFFLFFFKRS